MKLQGVQGLQVAHNMPFTVEPMEGKNVDKVLELGCQILSELTAEWWLSAGTLLGLYRDGDHIPHDTDIDVGVHGIVAYRDVVQTWPGAFRRAGFKFVRSMHHETTPMQLAFVHPEENIIFDIYFFYDNHKRPVIYNVNEHGVMEKPIELFAPKLGNMTHNNHNYNTPADIEAYLAMRYGDDWRIPRTEKKPWQEDATNLKAL